MKDFLKKVSSAQLVQGSLFVLIGCLILWRPEMFFNGIVYLIAAYFALMGILNLYTRLREKERTGLAYAPAILLLLLAIAVILLAKPIVSFIPFLLGLFVIISGVSQLLQEIKLQQQGLSGIGWFLFSLFMIIGGGILFFNPFKSVLLVFQLFGGILVLLGVFHIVGQLRNKENKNKF